MDVTMIGGAALLVSGFLALPESEGMYLPGPELDLGGNVNEATGKSGDVLIAEYEERYEEAPTSAYMAHAYDATIILLRAIEEVAVAEGGYLYLERAKLREALTATEGFEGVIGTIYVRRVWGLRDGPPQHLPPHRLKRHGRGRACRGLQLRAVGG